MTKEVSVRKLITGLTKYALSGEEGSLDYEISAQELILLFDDIENWQEEE